jgi:hypothetical protein
VVGLVAVLTGGLSLVTLFVIAISLLPSLFLYRLVLGLVREHAGERQGG